LADAAKQGYQGVLSNGYYIDLAFPASQHYVVDPLPADTNLTPEEQRRVLGGEATMWSEWVSPETVDSRVWPRTAAIAERLWSPREVNDVNDMYRRLDVVEYQLEELGLAHRKNQQMLLRRLARGGDTPALETLVSVIEPVKEYRRYRVRPQTMLSPLTGLIDAARPDARDAREFNLAVDGLLAGSNKAANTAKIRSLLTNWRKHETDLQSVLTSSPALAEALQLSDDFRTLNQMIQEATDAIVSASKQTSEWRNTRVKALDEVAKPKAGVEFAILLGVRKLVDAASGT
jgi:hexosaminidase